MGCYKNFKSVIYCTAQNMVNETEEALLEQLAFFQKYCGVDKVYLEPYRDGLMIPEEQLSMLIRVFKSQGIEVSGALTTTCARRTATSSAWAAPTAIPTPPCGTFW